MSARRSRDHVIGWKTHSFLVLHVASTGRQLEIACTPMPDSLTVHILAVDAPAPKEGSSLDDVLPDILGDHRHESLGTAEGLRQAMDIAEKYAARWQARQRRGQTGEPCSCKEIGEEATR